MNKTVHILSSCFTIAAPFLFFGAFIGYGRLQQDLLREPFSFSALAIYTALYGICLLLLIVSLLTLKRQSRSARLVIGIGCIEALLLWPLPFLFLFGDFTVPQLFVSNHLAYPLAFWNSYLHIAFIYLAFLWISLRQQKN